MTGIKRILNNFKYSTVFMTEMFYLLKTGGGGYHFFTENITSVLLKS